MTNRQSYDIPSDYKLTEEDEATYPWVQWMHNTGKALTTMQAIADQMSSDPITATGGTATDNNVILERLFNKFQDLI